VSVKEATTLHGYTHPTRRGPRPAAHTDASPLSLSFSRSRGARSDSLAHRLGRTPTHPGMVINRGLYRWRCADGG